MAESRTSPRRVETVERKRQALELRKAGATYDQIAATVGFANRGGAYKAVKAGIREILREPAEEVIQLECARLDEMLRALWPGVMRGDPVSIQRALGVMERRARLLGLDAPKKLEHSGPGGAPIETLISLVQQAEE